ncbi:MAG: hypothetical protein Q4F58_01815, partial [Candidatus Saccharibacteria bacterium]|nr:hypothetical protein [Candidatus Saccharibacteria bacterium]
PTTTETLLDNQTTATTQNYTIDVGARVDYTKPIGTYTNTYSLITVANPVAYAIEYWDVTETYDATTKKMIFQQVATPQASATNTTSSVVLNPDNTPTRNTYTFAGWCYNPNHTVDPSVNDMVVFQNNQYYNPGMLCADGTIYHAGDTLLIDPTVDNTNIKLYAMWTPTTFDQAFAAAGKSKATESGLQYYKMQDITSAICSAVSYNQTTILVDYRINIQNAGTTTSGQKAGTAYHVGRLQDGECWMLDNLDLNLNNQNVVNALTTSNTHVNSASITALKNGGGTDSNGRAQGALTYTNWDTSHNYSKPLVNRSGTCNTTTTTTASPCTYSGNYTNTTVLSTKTGVVTQGVGDGKIGSYYNYCAASAGSYCYSSSAGTGDATYDICPYRWKLPKGGPNTGADSVAGLINAITTISTTPQDSTKAVSVQGMLSMPFSGSFVDAEGLEQGNAGRFWTSSITDQTSGMYAARITAAVAGTPRQTRTHGYTLRCIAQ